MKEKKTGPELKVLFFPTPWSWLFLIFLHCHYGKILPGEPAIMRQINCPHTCYSRKIHFGQAPPTAAGISGTSQDY